MLFKNWARFFVAILDAFALSDREIEFAVSVLLYIYIINALPCSSPAFAIQICKHFCKVPKNKWKKSHGRPFFCIFAAYTKSL